MFDLYTDQKEVDLADNHIFQVVPIRQSASLLR